MCYCYGKTRNTYQRQQLFAQKIMSAPSMIYPTAEDCLMKTNLVCSVADCLQTFKCESNLNMHLSKTHRVMELKSSSSERQYYCPEISCSKYFINMKRLRQHYLKMHMAKVYTCVRCRKSFPSQSMLTSHCNYCEVTFACLGCQASYGSYETLKTHCRRKRHQILSKSEYKERATPEATKTMQSKVHQHTQTASATVLEGNGNYKHMNTQTERVASRDTSSNTSFDAELLLEEQIEKMTSSTQTQWPREDVFPVTYEFDSNYFNCNTETQTDLMFDNEIFNSDYYSHTYTQTCDDILNDLSGFCNMQTQTIVPEGGRSVESQTLMSSVDGQCPVVCKDIANSQTQTDAEFRQMLEIINS